MPSEFLDNFSTTKAPIEQNVKQPEVSLEELTEEAIFPIHIDSLLGIPTTPVTEEQLSSVKSKFSPQAHIDSLIQIPTRRVSEHPITHIHLPFSARRPMAQLAKWRLQEHFSDPFLVLKKTEPELRDKVSVKESSRRFFNSWVDLTAELRGHMVVFWSAEAAVESQGKWSSDKLLGILAVGGCNVRRRGQTRLQVRKNRKSVSIRFELESSCDLWACRLQRLSDLRYACLQDFKILAPVAEGGNGFVYLVEDMKTKERMALKAIPKSSRAFGHLQSKFAIEERRALIMAAGNPFTQQIRSAFQTRTHLFILSDFEQGGDLSTFLKENGRLDEHKAKSVIAEVITAIEQLHVRGIVHRDLKADNVLLKDGHIQLADLGVCKVFPETDKLQRTTTFCGTFPYMAPEMTSPIAERAAPRGYGFSVDVWGIGMLLYQLVVGKLPFHASAIYELHERHSKLERIRFPEFMSPDLTNFLRGCLVQDPHMRLGGGTTDLQKLKNHAFFTGIDWKKMLEGGDRGEGVLKERKLTEQRHGIETNRSKYNSNKEWRNHHHFAEQSWAHLLDHVYTRGLPETQFDSFNPEEYGDDQVWPFAIDSFHHSDKDYIPGFSYWATLHAK